MNIIETVRKLLTDYPKITEFTNGVHVDFTEPDSLEASSFGLASVGDKLLKEDILGNQTRQHNFILYASQQAATDYDRLANSTFLLELSYWLETLEGNPVTAEVGDVIKEGPLLSISCANAMLYSIPTGDINDGVTYQLQICAKYKIESGEF